MHRPTIWWHIPERGDMCRIERITRPSVGSLESTVLAQPCLDDGTPDLRRRPLRVPTRSLAAG